MTKHLILIGAAYLPGCYWHESADTNAQPGCTGVLWSEALVRVEQIAPQQAEWGEACVPLSVGDEFILRSAPSCEDGVFSGEPTPAFIAPYAPFCSLEGGPGFVCRSQPLTDAQGYEGTEVVVDVVGNTLIVNWHQPSSSDDPGATCQQQFQVSFNPTTADAQ
jgi:hypothetical protein